MAGETKENFIKQWTKAGIDQASVEKIASLIKERHYIQMLPTPEAQAWSKWGGEPDLSSSEWKDDERFLCQIDLNELPEGNTKKQLPPTGCLYFFIHKRGRDKGRVIFKAEKPPEQENLSSGTSTPIEFANRMEYVPPEYETDEFDDLDLPAEPGNLYMDWEEEFFENPKKQFKDGSNLLSGWSERSQKAASSLLRQKNANWEVLLTLHTQENRATKASAIGDIPYLSERLFYFIDKDALQKGDFSHIICRYDVP